MVGRGRGHDRPAGARVRRLSARGSGRGRGGGGHLCIRVAPVSCTTDSAFASAGPDDRSRSNRGKDGPGWRVWRRGPAGARRRRDVGVGLPEPGRADGRVLRRGRSVAHRHAARVLGLAEGPRSTPDCCRGAWAVPRLGFRSASSRPGRSVLSAALIASATFVIFSIDAFRRGTEDISSDPRSSSGGYVLLAEADLPILADPEHRRGPGRAPHRRAGDRPHPRGEVPPAAGSGCELPEPLSSRPTRRSSLRSRPSSRETVSRFRESLAATDAERANPWKLAGPAFDDGAVPAIADATSLQYVLHARVGDTFAVDAGGEKPLMLRFVGALSDSVLQGEADHRGEPVHRGCSRRSRAISSS